MLYNIIKINACQKNALLKSPGELGAVERVFSSVCLIRTGEDRLLALQNEDAVFSPMSILVSGIRNFCKLGFLRDDPVSHDKEKNRLIIRETVFDYSNCRYTASCIPIMCQELTSAGFLEPLEAYLQEQAAFLYEHLSEVVTGKHWSGTVQTEVDVIFYRRLREALAFLREGFRMVDESLVKQGLHGLLGMGPGLTPSGDDFFLGLATALLTDSKYAGILKGFKEEILALSLTHTTRVSQAFICYFLANCYSWPVYKLVQAMNNRNLPEFVKWLPHVGSFGHSSGQDYLSGLWWGLKFLTESDDVLK